MLVVLFSLQIFQILTIKIKTPDRPTFRFLSKTNLRSQHISIMEITLFGLLCTAVVHNIGTFLKLFSANAQCGLGLIISVEELILCYTFRIASQVGWLWMGSSSSLWLYSMSICDVIAESRRRAEDEVGSRIYIYIEAHFQMHWENGMGNIFFNTYYIA